MGNKKHYPILHDVPSEQRTDDAWDTRDGASESRHDTGMLGCNIQVIDAETLSQSQSSEKLN